MSARAFRSGAHRAALSLPARSVHLHRIGAGQPALSFATRTIASFVSKYTCQ
jgi:hypothetical protein